MFSCACCSRAPQKPAFWGVLAVSDRQAMPLGAACLALAVVFAWANHSVVLVQRWLVASKFSSMKDARSIFN